MVHFGDISGDLFLLWSPTAVSMRAPLLISGLTLIGVAALISPPRQSLAAQGRDLVRPVLLPVLWKGLESAGREGTPEEYAARGRVLMRLVPGWTDGHVHIAGHLAFEASMLHATTGDPDRAFELLMASLAYLDEVRSTGLDPAADKQILESQATFLTIRTRSDPELARRFRDREGESPSARARRYLEEIPGFADSPYGRDRLAFTIIQGLEFEIERREPRTHLIEFVDTALGLLSEEDPEIHAAWTKALQRLRAYLIRPDDALLRELSTFRELDDIYSALRRHPPKLP